MEDSEFVKTSARAFLDSKQTVVIFNLYAYLRILVLSGMEAMEEKGENLEQIMRSIETHVNEILRDMFSRDAVGEIKHEMNLAVFNSLFTRKYLKVEEECGCASCQIADEILALSNGAITGLKPNGSIGDPRFN